MNMNGIVFEEQYNNSVYETITYYFNAPKYLLDEFGIDYPNETESCTISIEFPNYRVSSDDCYVEISPAVDGSDIDYTDIDMPYEDIEKLISLAEKTKDKIVIWND